MSASASPSPTERCGASLRPLNTLGLLHEEQEQSVADESKIIWRYSLNEDKLDRETLLAMVHPAPF
jgi:hypothetical protein